ncbi:MAG TPA: hypothetical protein VNC50_08875, partial [Planctomycetia bacterium]|nr:hypothetical protein [Planctomycetia bacterium]
MVNVFARDVDAALTGLVKKLESEMNKNEKLFGYTAILTEDADGTEKKLEELAKTEKLEKMPLVLFEGKAGPKNYNIPNEADIVVHHWLKRKVKASYAFKKD